ncbi:MAG: hypothetical protein ACOZAA_05400 [Pseudomonadota bacterium]
MAHPPDNDAVVASIRANIVFEKMIVSALTVAGPAGVAHFMIGLGGRIAAGAFSIVGAGTELFNAIGYAFLFFLAGFAASAAVGIPLYRALERAKIRKMWPYALAAFALSFLILAAIGLAPSFETPARALYLVPGVAAAFLFGRKMRPFWLAAERAETPPPAVLKLH